MQTLFEPLSYEDNRLHRKIKKLISENDVNIRQDLHKNVLLAGGNTMFNGMGERLTKEVQTQMVKYSIGVKMCDNQSQCCWNGGLFLVHILALNKGP